MAKNQAIWKRVRFVYRRSSILTKSVVIAAVVFATVALLALKTVIDDTRAQTEAMKSQASQLQQDNEKLEQNIGNLGSQDSVEQIAKDELGLVDPDTLVVQPQP